MKTPILDVVRDVDSKLIMVKWSPEARISTTDVTNLCLSVIGSFLLFIDEKHREEAQNNILKSLFMSKGHISDYRVPLTTDGEVIKDDISKTI